MKKQRNKGRPKFLRLRTKRKLPNKKADLNKGSIETLRMKRGGGGCEKKVQFPRIEAQKTNSMN